MIEPITLIVATVSPLQRAGINALLSQESDLRVLGEAKDVEEIEKLVAELNPLIVVASFNLLFSGEKMINPTSWKKTALVVLLPATRGSHLYKALSIGASGYIASSDTVEVLVSVIRRAARGEILFSHDQFAQARQWHEMVWRKWASLTDREQEILLILAKGLDNRSIAESLGLSDKTIAIHVTHILNKLGVGSRLEAVSWLYNDYHFVREQTIV